MTRAAGVKAAFYRGGTSKAVVFNAADLPPEKAICDQIFLHVLGSPDPYRRQLDGMGGGLSSLSKVVIVEPSARDDADVDYTFVQIAVDQAAADYGAMCGNMASAVGPFAVEQRMVDAADGEVCIRVHNTNTGKVYHAKFVVEDGVAVESGNFSIPGVSGSGAKIELEFLNPAVRRPENFCHQARSPTSYESTGWAAWKCLWSMRPTRWFLCARKMLA